MAASRVVIIIKCKIERYLFIFRSVLFDITTNIDMINLVYLCKKLDSIMYTATK